MSRKVIKDNDNHIIPRKFLSHYLTVYNRYTGNEVGCIGNISSNSIMLMTPWMMEVGSLFCLRILLPAPLAGKTEIDFDAKCQWCHPDIDPRGYDSGYTVTYCGEEYNELVNALNYYFSFKEVKAQ